MSIHVVTKENRTRYQAALRQYFEIRHRTFVEGLAWEDIRRADGLERDQFDNENAIYLLLMENDAVLGGHRLLPTTGPHLFSDIFPHLCNVRGLVRSSRVYELTRTCVDEAIMDAKAAAKARLHLMAGLMEFCVSTGMEYFTVLGRMAIMKKYIRLGWKLCPLGEPVDMDGASQVAMRVETNAQALELIRRASRIKKTLLCYLGQVSPFADLLQAVQSGSISNGPFIHRSPVIPDYARNDFARDGVVCLREILDMDKVRNLAVALDALMENRAANSD